MGLLITGKTVTDDGWYGKANRHGAKAPRRAWLVNRQAAKDAKGEGMAGEPESRHVESAACLSADRFPAAVLHPCPAEEKVGQAFLPVRSGAWGAAVLSARARARFLPRRLRR